MTTKFRRVARRRSPSASETTLSSSLTEGLRTSLHATHRQYTRLAASERKNQPLVWPTREAVTNFVSVFPLNFSVVLARTADQLTQPHHRLAAIFFGWRWPCVGLRRVLDDFQRQHGPHYACPVSLLCFHGSVESNHGRYKPVHPLFSFAMFFSPS